MKPTFLLLALLLCGCEKSEPRKGNPVPNFWIYDSARDKRISVYEGDHAGHKYLITDQGHIIHAEHCPCKERSKWDGLRVHGVLTNVPTTMQYQTNGITEVAPELLYDIVRQLKEKK